jgi:penicillin-binding protein 1A
MNAKGLGFVFKWLFILALAGSVMATFVGGILFWHFASGLPQIVTVEDYKPPTVSQVVHDDGKQKTVLGEFFRTERRYVVPYDKIPEMLVHAFISAEDDRFFEHQGVNMASILRAAIANFRAGHVVQGGSTITQQVAKSLLLTPERSFNRKLKEFILAHRIEKNLTKQQILYLYLNQIYLGHGAYGVQAAARTFFRKDVSNITLAEAAVLAGMPQAPGKYSPHLNPQKAKERQRYVLKRMYENNYITQAQLSEAAAEAIRIYDEEDVNKKYSGYFVEQVRRQMVEKYGDKAVLDDGLTIEVPTSPQLATAARKSIQEGLRSVDKRLGYRGPLDHLKDADAIGERLKKMRLELIARRLGYEMFMPDGRLDATESLRSAGLTSETQLLEPDELYEAVVMSPDDKRKSVTVNIGAVRAELPVDRMKWARGARDEKNPQFSKFDPSVPTRMFRKGDVILVKPAEIKGEQVVVQLEQEPQVQGALFSIDAQSGQVLAMEGGYDYKKSEFNRAEQAQRQPGSSFKPIIFSAGLEKGFNAATIIVDSPIVYEDIDNGKWKPSNFEEKFYGDTTFRQALIKSRNVPTIKIVQALGVTPLIDYAKRIGMNAKFNNDLSISLGSIAISLTELTRTYALFPRLGKRVEPKYILRVRDRDGKLLEDASQPGSEPMSPPVKASVATGSTGNAVAPANTIPDPNASPRPNVAFPSYPPPEDPNQVMDPRVAYVMTHLMKEVIAYGTGHDAKSLGRSAAGKTGTTNDYIDAWFMGFTPNVVTGVWVGYDSQKTIGPNETGARAALPIWLGFMREAVKNYPESVDFPMPPGVVFATINPNTGKLAAPNTPNAIKEAFIEGTEPKEQAGPNDSAESASEFLKEDIE